MMKWALGTTPRSREEEQQKISLHNILVICKPGAQGSVDWAALFDGKTLADGAGIRVMQVGWDDILHVAAMTPGESNNHRGSVRCEIRVSDAKTTSGQRVVTFIPEFVLVRNEVVTPELDARNQLYGLMYGGLPSVNSLESIASFCERPVVQAQVNRIARKLGKDNFPLVEQEYFSSSRGMMYGSAFPAVVKVGGAHAGVGKMKVQDHRVMNDFQSVLTMTSHYCTGEPFITADYDVRIQKVGTKVRAYHRRGISGSWKTNTGSAMLEEVECSEKYKLWVREASLMMGGLDILSIDAIHSIDDDIEYIMEVNGTSSGLGPDHNMEDCEEIVSLVISKWNHVLENMS